MLFARVAAALLLSFIPFAPTVYCQTSGKNAITFPNQFSKVDTSEPFEITWKPDTKGTVTIVLLKGPQKNLNDLGPIAASIKNTGSFTWNVPKSMEDMSTMKNGEIYGFKIIDDLTGDFEYSPPFHMIVPGSTYVDPNKAKDEEVKDKEEDKEEEKEEEKDKTTTSSATKTSSTTSTTKESTTTKSTTTKSTTTKSTTTESTTTSTPTTTSTKKSTTTTPSTTKTTKSTSSTTTTEKEEPTPTTTEDAFAQQTNVPTETLTSTPTAAEKKKEEKGDPLGIPIIAWVGIGIGGIFAALILSYCISLGVRNHRLRKEERERELMPNSDFKPTQAAGPYQQLNDDLEKGPDTPGTVPYGPTAFAAAHRDTVGSSNYSNSTGYGAVQKGNNIEMAEYGNSQQGSGGYYEEPGYNQNYSNPPHGGQHSFRDPQQTFQGSQGLQQGGFNGPAQGYATQSDGAFSGNDNYYPAQQPPYNGGRQLSGGHSAYRY